MSIQLHRNFSNNCNMYKVLFALSLAASALAAPECPPLDSPFYFLPHETDCSKFYICAHGNPLLQTCPEGTHFSPFHMVCQNPWFAGCDISPPESELPCTRPDSILFHPHPATCSKYYVCDHGTPQVFDCPQGLEFNADLRECVWPHESNCKISQDGPTDGESQNGGSQNGGSQNGGPQNGGSQDGCQSGALSAHEECNKFYLCAHGVNVEMECLSGLQWSSEVEQCVWPHESDCGSQDDAEKDEQNGDRQNGAVNNGRCVNGALSAHEDCGKYNICNHGAPLAMDCPAGLHFNSKLSYCDWPSSAGCQK